MKTRKAAFAGKFYPKDRNELENLIAEISLKVKPNLRLDLANKNIYGAILPHAGYIYSAKVALPYFEILAKSNQPVDTFVIVNPNHTGYGAAISLDSCKAWETPLGEANLDIEMMSLLSFPKIQEAHKYEHSAEVLLPLLQYFYPEKFRILPITLSAQNTTNARKIAEEIFSVSKILNRKIHFLASSDFSHYVEPEFGRTQDDKLINAIMSHKIDAVNKIVRQNNISACGYGAIMSLMHFSKLIGHEYKLEILGRGNSGEAYPSTEVVDYVSMLFYE